MKTYRFIYKCRRCGKLDDSLGTGSKIIALKNLVLATANSDCRSADTPNMISVHTCDDKSFGVTDLIGVEEQS